MPQSFCHLFYCVNQAVWAVSQEIHCGNNLWTLTSQLRTRVKRRPLKKKWCHLHLKIYMISTGDTTSENVWHLYYISPHHISGGLLFGEHFHSLTALESLYYYCINGSIMFVCFFSNKTWQRWYYCKCFHMGEITDTEPLGYAVFILWRSDFNNWHTCCYHSKYRLVNTEMFTASRLTPG